MRVILVVFYFLFFSFHFSFGNLIFNDKVQYYDFGASKKNKFDSSEELLGVNPRSYDVLQYDLFLDWYKVMKKPASMDSLDRIWYGRNTIIFQSKVDNLTTVELDAVSLIIDSVFVLDGNEFRKVQPTPKITGTKILIPLIKNMGNGEIGKIKIFYTYARNIPEENYRGFFLYPKGKFVGRLPAPFYDSVFVEERIAYTMSEPEDARYWMPSNDAPYDKADAKITVRVPNEYVVASNGYLEKVLSDGDSAKIFFWVSDKPITTYLMSVTTSKFVVFSDWYRKVTSPMDSVEIQYYVWEKDYKATKTDGSEYNARNTLGTTPSMMEFFSKVFIEYPFVKYGMASVMPFHFGGMEHQTITTINRVWLRQNTQFGIAHELAHQWIGDLVTCATWNDIWFNEGGATWSEALYAENLYGKWGYYYFLLSSRKSYLDKGGLNLPPIYGLPTNTIFGDYAVLVYQKASWIYHMLKNMLGDSLFFQTFRSFLKDYSYKSITTDELIQYFSEKIPNPVVDFQTFFDQWLFKAGHPKFLVHSSIHNYKNEFGDFVGTVTISQIQNGNNVPEVFVTPIRLIFKSGDTLTAYWDFVLNQKINSFTISLPFFPDSIFVDTTFVLCEVGDIVLSTISTNSNEQMIVFPNPIVENQPMIVQLPVDIKLPAQMVIFDLIGNKLLHKEVNTSNSDQYISIQEVKNFIPGTYILEIFTSERHYHYLFQKN